MGGGKYYKHTPLWASVTPGFSASVDPEVGMSLSYHSPGLPKASAFDSGTSWQWGTSSLLLLPEEG